jgi:hypothetical protein
LRGRSLLAVLLASLLMVSNWGLFLPPSPHLHRTGYRAVSPAALLGHAVRQPAAGEKLSRQHLLAAITALIGLGLACGLAGLRSEACRMAF